MPRPAQQEDVASIAKRVLAAYKDGENNGLRKAIDRARRSTNSVPLLDMLEAERMEVLVGALESLVGERPEQTDAALYLLRHLVNSRAQA